MWVETRDPTPRLAGTVRRGGRGESELGVALDVGRSMFAVRRSTPFDPDTEPDPDADGTHQIGPRPPRRAPMRPTEAPRRRTRSHRSGSIRKKASHGVTKARRGEKARRSTKAPGEAPMREGITRAMNGVWIPTLRVLVPL